MSDLDKSIRERIAAFAGEISTLSESECAHVTAYLRLQLQAAENSLAYYKRALELVSARSSELTDEQLRNRVRLLY